MNSEEKEPNKAITIILLIILIAIGGLVLFGEEKDGRVRKDHNAILNIFNHESR